MNSPTTHRHFGACVAAILLGACFAPPVTARGPNGDPQIADTVKATVSVDLAPVFAKQMRLIEQRRAAWLEQAERATPKLLRTPKKPVAIIAIRMLLTRQF